LLWLERGGGGPNCNVDAAASAKTKTTLENSAQRAPRAARAGFNIRELKERHGQVPSGNYQRRKQKLGKICSSSEHEKICQSWWLLKCKLI
jgi:hypothetical protein